MACFGMVDRDKGFGYMAVWLVRSGGLRSFFYVNLDRFAEAGRHVGRWNMAVGFDELLAHRYLTDDHCVQRSDFSGGPSLVVNFGPQPYQTDDGRTMPRIPTAYSAIRPSIRSCPSETWSRSIQTGPPWIRSSSTRRSAARPAGRPRRG
ncbi:MAG TPA: hypothetical protein VMY37_00580 [Thermoguttaceae bacterium]|nr:hypothetical protein [Thermoguttaceae bacterium]